MYGRVNHDRVGASMHEVGLCVGSMGKTNEARSW